MHKLSLAAVVASTIAVAGCSQSVSEYSNETPVLKLDQFFQGQSRAWGVLHDWQGRQTVRFTAELCGSWQGNTGDLYELFYFSDGRVEQRHWQLQQNADGSVSQTQSAVAGVNELQRLTVSGSLGAQAASTAEVSTVAQGVGGAPRACRCRDP